MERDPDGGAPPRLESLSGRWHKLAVGAAIAAVAFGLVLRFWTHSALWLDEALTVDIARQPLRELPTYLRRDGAPPLYYVLLHVWMGVFGSSDLGVRSLSGVISVATLPGVWLAARRVSGKIAATAAVVLVATAPFAIYYATEARMYALVMFLTAWGMVALGRALERPRPGNLVAVGLCAAALLYSQYWALYLLSAVGLWLAWSTWRQWHAGRRWPPAAYALGAVAVGCLTFLPWVPTFVFQARHTGTPWAAPANFAAIINAVTGFTDNQATLTTAGSNQGRLLALVYFLLAFLGVFGIAKSRSRIELDLRTRRPLRPLAFVVLATLALAVTGGIVSGSAFSPRYASVVFIPLIVVVAAGLLTMVDRRVRVGLLAVAVAAGLALGVETIWTQRTQAPQIAAVLAAHAHPGDIVAFCPDQLGPAVYRITPRGRYQMTTFPRGTSPEFVNWVDYIQVAQKASAAGFARALEAAAGHTHQIWLVWATGYRGFDPKCQQIAGDLLNAPGYGGHQWVNQKPGTYYEPMALTQFAPPPLPRAVPARP